MSTDDLAGRRVANATDNREVRPVDMLRALANDIEAGRTPARGLVVVTWSLDADGMLIGETFYSNTDMLSAGGLLAGAMVRIWQ